MSNLCVLPFSVALFTVYFLLPCSLGAYYKYPYDNPYYKYDFGYAKLPSSVRHFTVAVPPPLKKTINGKLYSRMDVLPYYAYGKQSLYWKHPKFHRKAHKEEKRPELPESAILKRQGEPVETTSLPALKPNKDELAIAFLTPAKKQVKEFKMKMDELKNSTAMEAKSQKYADEMEEFSPKPSIMKMGYKIWNWYKGYNESPAPFYSDPRTFNHPFGNKNKMLKIPPAAFATHYFEQDVPLVTKSRFKKTKSWSDSDNITPDEMHDMSEEEKRDSERERRPKCTKGSNMLYCNGDALTEFMGALERHVKKKSSSNKHRGYGGRPRYTNDDFFSFPPESSREAYENAKHGYTEFYDKGNSKFKYVSPEDNYYDSYDDSNLNANLNDYDVDIEHERSRNPVKILVVLTKKGFSGSQTSNSRSSSQIQQSGIYPPKYTYDTPTLIAGKHRESNNNPENWQDPSFFRDEDSAEYTRTKSYPQFDEYNYDRPSKNYGYDYDKPRKSSSRRDRSRKYDKLMDELMTAIEGRIQDIDPGYNKNKNHNPSQINENDYEPAPFWPVPRDFTSEERLKYARLKAAKAMNDGPDIGWFNRS